MNKKAVIKKVVTIGVSLLLLVMLNYMMRDGHTIFMGEHVTEQARVISIDDIQEQTVEIGMEEGYVNRDIYFSAEILTGEFKNQTVTAMQNQNNYILSSLPEVSMGDKVLLSYGATPEEVWYFMDYSRMDGI